jgi:hypothetical protein
VAGTQSVHDTVVKTYRHLNFFQHECHLQMRTPRVKLPDGSVRLAGPEFAGRLHRVAAPVGAPQRHQCARYRAAVERCFKSCKRSDTRRRAKR